MISIFIDENIGNLTMTSTFIYGPLIHEAIK